MESDDDTDERESKERERQRFFNRWPLDPAPYQSLQTEGHEALAEKIYNTVSGTHFFSDSKNEAWRESVWAMVAHMIDCERKAWALDYFVFYRSVSRKYALYEFNTIMLAVFSHTKPSVDALRLVCVPSLCDLDYPESIEAAFEMYRGEGNDSTIEASQALLSVNNCINPTRRQTYEFIYHVIHDVEASPLTFLFDGYDETIQYTATMRAFTETFFGLSKADANALVAAIMSLYDGFIEAPNADGNAAHGHTLQICIPRAAMDRFVFPCVAWGHPVGIFKEGAGDCDDPAVSHVLPHFKGKLYYSQKSTEGMRPVPQTEFLRSTDLNNLQSRILAHPNLFLKHGAVTNVFHGNQSFDEAGFRRALLDLLRPHINAAIARGQHLSYSRFDS